MNQRLLRSCLAAFVALLPGAANGADGTFRLGAHLGAELWDTTLEVPLLTAPGDLKPGFKSNVGLLGQYVLAAGDASERDFFVGFEASWSGKKVTLSDTFAVAEVPIAATGEVGWHLDLLWLVGYDFGRISAALAGGASYMASELTASGAGLAGEDANMHLGWKIAPGVEVELGPASALLFRVGYTQYQGKNYTAPGATLGLPVDLDINVEPRLLDVRVGWVYRFGGR